MATINGMQAKKIGSGEFSTAYRVVDSDIVIIATRVIEGDHENNNTKEIYSHIEAKHVPYMSTIDTEVYMPKKGYVNLYESRYYAPLTAKNTQAWKDYQALKKAWEKIMAESAELLNSKRFEQWHAVCDNFIRYLEEHAIVSDDMIHALDMIHTWSTAYGPNFLFEFSPRNLKVDSNGDLILLDIVFFRSPKNRW